MLTDIRKARGSQGAGSSVKPCVCKEVLKAKKAETELLTKKCIQQQELPEKQVLTYLISKMRAKRKEKEE